MSFWIMTFYNIFTGPTWKYKLSVLVYWGGYNKNTINGVMYTHIFLIVLAAWEVQDHCAGIFGMWGLMRAHFLKNTFPHSRMGELILWYLLFKGNNSIQKGLPLLPNHLLITSLGSHFVTLSPWRLGFNIWISGEHKHSDLSIIFQNFNYWKILMGTELEYPFLCNKLF